MKRGLTQEEFENIETIKKTLEIVREVFELFLLECSLYFGDCKIEKQIAYLLIEKETKLSKEPEINFPSQYKDSLNLIKNILKKATEQERIQAEKIIEKIRGMFNQEYARLRRSPSSFSNESSFEPIRAKLTEMINLCDIRDKVNENVAKKYKIELNHSVKTYWLRRLAIYRVYSELQKKHPRLKSKLRAFFDDPIKFKYHANSGMLIPDDDLSKDKYQEIVRECFKDNLPSRIIAAFDPREHYVRINFPRNLDRVFINLEYDFTLESDDDSSKGLLIEILEILGKRKFTGSYISNTIVNYEEGKREKGIIYIIGYFVDEQIKTENEIKQAMSDIEAELRGLGSPDYGRYH